VNPQEQAVLDTFRATGAYLNGHFRLTSGLHSPEYLQCALVLQHPAHAEELESSLAAALGRLTRRHSTLSPPRAGRIDHRTRGARALAAGSFFAKGRIRRHELRRVSRLNPATWP